MSGLHEKKGTSIQSRLILLLLCVLIPVLAIQAYIYYDNYQDRRGLEFRANLEIARAVAKSFESFVQDVLHQELAIGLAITSSQPMTPRDITRILNSSRDDVAVRDFTWLNPKGDAIYSSSPAMIGINYSDRSYFRDVVNGREWMISELMIAKTTGKPVFGISRGIRDGKGALLGIVFAVIVPEKLEARLAVERRKGGGHALIDNKGMLVFRYPAINATWEERNWLRQYPRLEKILKGEELADRAVFAPFEGKTRLTAATPVSSIGWAVTAATREEDLTGPILSSIGKSALLFLSVSLAAFFIALAVSRKITRPVTALRTHALAFGQGEVPEQVKINHVLEFQDLADAFNTMAEKVKAREMDLHASEQQLRQSQELLEAVTQGSDVIIAAMDMSFCYTYFNKAYEAEMKRLTGKDINVGMSIIEAFAHMPDQQKIVMEEWRHSLRGETTNKTIEFGDSTRHRKVYDVFHSPVWDAEGNIVGAGEVAHDITERKKVEEDLKERTAKLEEINKELESFSYSISHDLRAPLRAIDGYARMILKKEGDRFDEDTMRKFNAIRSNSQMMGKLIDDILNLSRLGRAKMSIVNMEMEGIIEDVWKEQQTINPERNMTLTIQAMPSGYGDRILIGQVFSNLIANAVKFSMYRNPAQIEAGGYIDGDDHVYYIKDNGAGFDMAYYDKLFGIFQRLHNNPDFEGTGVGLATIKRVISMHGGHVWAEGKVEEGATFYFSLPSRRTQDEITF